LPFSALIASLTSGEIDIISAAMTGSPERAKVVDFGKDVYAYGEGLVVRSSDTTDYTGFADMKGKKVGAQIGTPCWIGSASAPRRTSIPVSSPAASSNASRSPGRSG
jgi:ABC-type amino acid transport substrate-binding protein